MAPCRFRSWSRRCRSLPKKATPRRLGDRTGATSLPAALCGRLGERGDADGYRFEAKKGVNYAFEVMARRAGSECDPVVRRARRQGIDRDRG